MSLEAITGIVASAAGTQGAVSSGAKVERAASHRARRVASPDQERADEVAELDAQNLEARDRDADGRQAWQAGRTRPPEPGGRAVRAPAGGGDAPGRLLDVTL